MFDHGRMISAGLLFFLSPSQYDNKNNSEYIKWFYFISYFERYVDSKSDYLELLLSVYRFHFDIILLTSGVATQFVHVINLHNVVITAIRTFSSSILGHYCSTSMLLQ